MQKKISTSRREILRLRARVVAVERACLAALNLVLRLRPEELNQNIETSRRLLEEGYQDVEFSPDLADGAERKFLAAEVEKSMRSLQAELGFKGGVSQPEEG
ncbi:MAG: hypothetical protein JWM36_3354 [Hyphomicrobiales bacterium]|nr:hypothetical protein [Hyphomicrobiales bacterium]